MGLKYPKIAGFELVHQIGGGGFSTVFRAVNLADHRVAACKLIALAPPPPAHPRHHDRDGAQAHDYARARAAAEKEMRVHAALAHAHVLAFIAAAVVEPAPAPAHAHTHAHTHTQQQGQGQGQGQGQERERERERERAQRGYVPGIYMLLELAAGGDLFDKIAPDVGVGDAVAHFYFAQLVAGMAYIHAAGVCHRDLKPENLLLSAAGTLKIADFGLAAVFRVGARTRLLSERCGSLPYVAPELGEDAPYRAEPVDVWGMGVILYTLLLGNTPWDEPTPRSPEYARYLTGEGLGEAPWSRLGAGALSLIRGLLAVDPEARMTLGEVQAHPWCLRPSQLARQGASALAEQLTASLRAAGDLVYAAPNVGAYANAMETGGDGGGDGDEEMLSASHSSQFTQSLLLFSQTQSGRRYTPHLTRFYASLGPALLMARVHESLEGLHVRCKAAPAAGARLRLRVGGFDRRRVVFKGWVEVEAFSYAGLEGSFCVMQRDVGSPISWRQLWKALIVSAAVEPHVLRK